MTSHTTSTSLTAADTSPRILSYESPAGVSTISADAARNISTTTSAAISAAPRRRRILVIRPRRAAIAPAAVETTPEQNPTHHDENVAAHAANIAAAAEPEPEPVAPVAVETTPEPEPVAPADVDDAAVAAEILAAFADRDNGCPNYAAALLLPSVSVYDGMADAPADPTRTATGNRRAARRNGGYRQLSLIHI